MLTIGKLGTSRGRLEYYDAQVAAGVEEYYAGRGESPGRWRGRGAAAIGLAAGSRVERNGFMALMRGRHPVDGVVLREMGARSKVAGFDLTWSAPKSVSVLFAVEDDEMARDLLAAHERAVDEALGYLEREACWTRRGRDGAECVRGDGFIAASYRHRMSRAGDPQLHTHVVVANMTRADGRHTALDARSLYAHKSAAGAVYRAVLRAEVCQRLPWLSWRPAGRGLFELEGVPEPVLRHFSQRRVEIEERAAELVGAGAVAELSRERMQGIALATRKAKRYGVDSATWREQARARAAEHGLGEGELARLRTRPPLGRVEPDMSALAARFSGTAGLTARHNTFATRHALAEIAGAFPQGAPMAQLDAALSWYLGHETVVPLDQAAQSEPRFTTQGLLDRERQILRSARRRARENVGILPGPLVDQILARQSCPLNDDQAAAVRAIASSGRGVEGITALAGTGKTTMIAAVAGAYRRAGWRVVGAAPTARAARQLREIAGVTATTMHALVARLDRAGGLAPRTLLVLDEAGTAPTRLSAELFLHAERAGTKIVAIGDPGQLGAVQAGGWLAAIARNQDGPALRQVMRQQKSGEREALQALHDGDPEPYLDHKRSDIVSHETEIDALLHLVHCWHEAQRQHGPRAAVMITRDNLMRERLNRAARALLKDDGSLSPHSIMIGGREFAPGDRVIARRNHRAADIDNGSLATVVTVSSDGAMIVETDAGEPRALDANYVSAHLEHAYVLTSHGAQGATVSWAGVIGRPTEFTREWAYTSLSRARQNTAIHLISERTDRDRERDEYAPPESDLTAEETLKALHRAMRRSEAEPLAAEQLPPLPSRSPPAPMTSRAKASATEPSGVELLRRPRPQPGRTLRMQQPSAGHQRVVEAQQGLGSRRYWDRRRDQRGAASRRPPIDRSDAEGSFPGRWGAVASDLLTLDERHLWHPYSPAPATDAPVAVASASGTRLRLAAGTELVDAMASWWCAIHGYRHPVLDRAVSEQLARMAHVMFGGLTHEPAVRLAARLAERTPDGLDRVFFVDSGSVAVEVAIKMSLQYWRARGRPDRHRLLTVRGGYHGDTFGAMAVCDPAVRGTRLRGSRAAPAQVCAGAWTQRRLASARVSCRLRGGQSLTVTPFQSLVLFLRFRV